MPHELAELRAREVLAATRREGEPEPDLELPFDLKKVKNEFIKIVNYKSTFGKDCDNLAYKSDYGVKATSRVIKPGSTLEQLGASAVHRQKRKEQKEQLLETRKQYQVTRSLQYLCSLQSGGAEKFREKVGRVKRVTSPEKEGGRSRGPTATDTTKTPNQSQSLSHTASTTSSSIVEYNLELDAVENDILKNLKANEAKRELMKSFEKERNMTKPVKKSKSTPQLYRRLSRLPSAKDNLLPPLERQSRENSTPSTPNSPKPECMLTQLRDTSSVDEGHSHDDDNIYDEEFADEGKEGQSPAAINTAACGSPAAKVGSPVDTTKSPMDRPKAAHSPKKPTAASNRNFPKKPVAPANVPSSPSKSKVTTPPKTSPSPTKAKPTKSGTDLNSTAPASTLSPNYNSVNNGEYGDDFIDETSSPEKLQAVKSNNEEIGDYDVDFEEESAVDRGNIAGFGSMVV